MDETTIAVVREGTMKNKKDYLEISNFSFPYTYSEAEEIPSQLKRFIEKVNESWKIRIVQVQVLIFPANKKIHFHLLEQGLSCKNNLGTVLNINTRINSLSSNLCPIIPTLIGWLNESLDSGPYSKYTEMEYDTASLTLVDFDAVMRNAFFESDYFVQLAKCIKERYSFLDFIIRWKEDEFYYLIFKNDSALQEENQQLINSIIKEINGKIIELDYLHVFTNCHPMAVTTSYEKIKKDGSIMGIMRNNVKFGPFFEQ